MSAGTKADSEGTLVRPNQVNDQVNSQKYIADPPPSGFTTNRILKYTDVISVIILGDQSCSRT